MVHGIGKSYAQKIVDHFGADTLRVISEDSGRLHESLHGKTRAKSIKAAWDEQAAVRDVMMFLQTYGITPASACDWSNTAPAPAASCRTSPTDWPTISNASASKPRTKLPSTSASRPIPKSASMPASCTPCSNSRMTATPLACKRPSPSTPSNCSASSPISSSASAPDRARAVSVQAYSDRQELLGPACQRPQLAGAEQRIAAALIRIHATRSTIPPITVAAAVDWAQHRAGFQFADQQAQALRNSLQAKVAIITGGPGTGKTTILRAVVDILRAKRARILLASPTGRAAQRLSEAAGAPASTIHRLLKYDGANRSFVHNEDNPLPCDMLIVDEASMLDTRLAASLFQAIPSGAQLLLVGDADQLPSVGAGNVLGDLMHAPPATVTRLDTIYRQGKESGIITTAHAILQGEAHPGATLRSLRDLSPTRISPSSKPPTPNSAPKPSPTSPATTCPRHSTSTRSASCRSSPPCTVAPASAPQRRTPTQPEPRIQGPLPAALQPRLRLHETHFRETTRKPCPPRWPTAPPPSVSAIKSYKPQQLR